MSTSPRGGPGRSKDSRRKENLSQTSKLSASRGPSGVIEKIIIESMRVQYMKIDIYLNIHHVSLSACMRLCMCFPPTISILTKRLALFVCACAIFMHQSVVLCKCQGYQDMFPPTHTYPVYI